MPRIIAVRNPADILPEHRSTPVGFLLAHHNLRADAPAPAAPQALIGMCMDGRQALRVPKGFAFVLRTAGANMRDNEFRISYAIAVGGVRTIILIAHTDCGMAKLRNQRDQFVSAMVTGAGWDAERAISHYNQAVRKWAIRDEVEFVLGEADRLRVVYPRVTVAPLLYRVDDDLLYQVAP